MAQGTCLDADWLHCNRCQAHSRRGASLFLSNCGHVLCLSCKMKGGSGECLECRQAGVKYVAITDNMQERTDVGHLFQNTEEQAVFLIKVLQFQKMHQFRIWEHWMQQEKTRESERWSAEQLKEAEALDSEELKRRCQELEQVGAEQQRVAELEHYIAQLRITISRQEGAEQGPEFEAGPPKRPRNGSTESTPVCSAAPRHGPSPQPRLSLHSHGSWQSPLIAGTCTSSGAYRMPPPRLPPPWAQKGPAQQSPSTDHSQSHFPSSDSMLQTRPVLQGSAREVRGNIPPPSSHTTQHSLPPSMKAGQHGSAHQTGVLETGPSPRVMWRSGGGSKSPSPRTTPTPSLRGGIFGAAKVSAPARRPLAQSPSPRNSKTQPSPLVTGRQSSSAHTPSPRTAGSDRGGLRITPNRLSVRGPPVGGRIGTVPKYVSPGSRVAELVRACGLKPLSPAPSPQLRSYRGTHYASSLASVGCPT